MIGVNWFEESVEYPAKNEPAWSKLVERWYQLDTPSFVLTEGYWRLREKLKVNPEWLLLASPGASNLTDAQFAAAPTPAKFVHTLPNIRSASLLQVMHWSGKVLCLQKDPFTLSTALGEGLDLVEEGPVWIASVTVSGNAFTARFLTLSINPPSAALKIAKNRDDISSRAATHDKDLVLWQKERVKTDRSFVGSGFTLSRWAE